MWTVKAEAGRLQKVLISNTWYRMKIAIPTLDWFAAFRKNIITDKYREAWEGLPWILDDEGVKWYDVSALIKEIVDGATLEDKKDARDGLGEGAVG